MRTTKFTADTELLSAQILTEETGFSYEVRLAGLTDESHPILTGIGANEADVSTEAALAIEALTSRLTQGAAVIAARLRNHSESVTVGNCDEHDEH